jgi:hypothetical protein
LICTGLVVLILSWTGLDWFVYDKFGSVCPKLVCIYLVESAQFPQSIRGVGVGGGGVKAVPTTHSKKTNKEEAPLIPFPELEAEPKFCNFASF